MVRRNIKGFTVLDCIFVLSLLASVFLIAAPAVCRVKKELKVSEAIEQLSYQQIVTIKENDYQTVEDDEGYYAITFNRRGNVMKAETVHLATGTFIVSLGTGRFYEKP